eukprot:2583730-Prymnesium_polylepis.2
MAYPGERAHVERVRAQQPVPHGREDEPCQVERIDRDVVAGVGYHPVVDERCGNAVARVPAPPARDPRLTVRIRIVHRVKLCHRAGIKEKEMGTIIQLEVPNGRGSSPSGRAMDQHACRRQVARRPAIPKSLVEHGGHVEARRR